MLDTHRLFCVVAAVRCVARWVALTGPTSYSPDIGRTGLNLIVVFSLFIVMQCYLQKKTTLDEEYMYVVRRLEKMRTSNIKNRQKYEYEGRTFKNSNS